MVLEAEGVADLVKELFVCGLVGHRQCYNFASFPFKRMKACIKTAIRVKFIFKSREKPGISISNWVFMPTSRQNNMLGCNLNTRMINK